MVSKNQVTLEPTMEESINHFPLCKKLDANQESIVDIECDVFGPIFIINPVSESKKRLHHETSHFPNSVKPSLSQFTLEQSYPFPEFIQWCVDNYSKTERVIMNSTGLKVLCWVDAQTMRESLGFSESIVIEYEQLMRKKLPESTRKVLMKKKVNFFQKSSSLINQSKIYPSIMMSIFSRKVYKYCLV